MIQSKRRYPNQLLAFFMSWNIQLVLGYVFSVLCVGALVWGGDWKSWLNWDSRVNSLLVVSAVYFLSFISLRQFLSHLGYLNLRYVIPVVLVWAAIGYGVLFILRLSYSVYFLAFSLLAVLIFLWAAGYVRNRYGQFRVAYIDKGKVTNLPNMKRIEWVKLMQPIDLSEAQADIVMADLRADLGDEWEEFLADCTLKHIPVYHSSRLIEAVSGRVKIDHLYENDLGSLLPSRGYLLIKRLVDMLLILCSLPLAIPVMIVTAVLIVLESRGGVFFFQERIGQGGKPFTVYKFRSMCKDSEKSGAQFAQANDMRVTRVGRVIRKTRIDELPQFFNVLKGEMSLIGPRPEQKKFVDEFKKEIPFYDYRHIVRPGISGWAQVVHGYAADTEDTRVKLEHDFYYIKNFSFSLDLLIIFKTIQTMLTGFGAR